MKRAYSVALAAASALGDLRTAQTGDVVLLHSDAVKRKDWPRYADALNVAHTRGADIRKVK
jgi:hypothetical protein